MTKLSEYREFLQSVRSSVGYLKSYSLLQFTLSLTRLMKVEDVSGRKLAERLVVSAQQVSKVLRGNENVTIETMAKYADALGAVVHIHVAKRGVRVQWREVPSAGTERAKMTGVESAVLDIGSNNPSVQIKSSGSLSEAVRVPITAFVNTTDTQYLTAN